MTNIVLSNNSQKSGMDAIDLEAARQGSSIAAHRAVACRLFGKGKRLKNSAGPRKG